MHTRIVFYREHIGTFNEMLVNHACSQHYPFQYTMLTFVGLYTRTNVTVMPFYDLSCKVLTSNLEMVQMQTAVPQQAG